MYETYILMRHCYDMMDDSIDKLFASSILRAYYLKKRMFKGVSEIEEDQKRLTSLLVSEASNIKEGKMLKISVRLDAKGRIVDVVFTTDSITNAVDIAKVIQQKIYDYPTQ